MPQFMQSGFYFFSLGWPGHPVSCRIVLDLPLVYPCDPFERRRCKDTFDSLRRVPIPAFPCKNKSPKGGYLLLTADGLQSP